MVILMWVLVSTDEILFFARMSDMDIVNAVVQEYNPPKKSNQKRSARCRLLPALLTFTRAIPNKTASARRGITGMGALL
jgi:hypothetical protein